MPATTGKYRRPEQSVLRSAAVPGGSGPYDCAKIGGSPKLCGQPCVLTRTRLVR